MLTHINKNLLKLYKEEKWLTPGVELIIDSITSGPLDSLVRCCTNERAKSFNYQNVVHWAIFIGKKETKQVLSALN